MPRDEMTLIARCYNTQKSLKWSSNVQDGDCKDGEKILCNRCPLRHEIRERGRGEMLYENMPKPNTIIGRPAITSTTNISNT